MASGSPMIGCSWQPGGGTGPSRYPARSWTACCSSGRWRSQTGSGPGHNGVLVDEHCRTSLPDVYAAGDVTNHQHPIFGRLRVEHWNNGFQQGKAAARAMLGGTRPYDYLHTFWSDQYEHMIEYVGFAKSW